MSSLYQSLEDRRADFIGSPHWIGNLRWVAQEQDCLGKFVFYTCPLDETEGEFLSSTDTLSAARRILLGLSLSGLNDQKECCYRADEVEVRTPSVQVSMLLPFQRYGALVHMKTVNSCRDGEVRISTSSEMGRIPAVEKPFRAEMGSDYVVWHDGAYVIAFKTDGELCRRTNDGFSVRPRLDRPLRLAMAFQVSEAEALQELDALFYDPEGIRRESSEFWDDYLRSCPVAMVESKDFSPEEIRHRQYWHWQCLLANAYELPFNQLKAFMAPDKAIWFGSWSNDGPDCLRALALTNQHALARQCLVEYVRTALDVEGNLSWYLHGTGEGCLGKAGDSGRFSHGVPVIVTAVADYIHHTGDAEILDLPADPGGTVWEKLKRYMLTVFQRRDINGDGLVEWVNLWEGGADDEVGCFFNAAPLPEWVEAITKGTDAEIRDFYAKNSRPVANLYEQNFFLTALKAFEKLSLLRGEMASASFARERFDRICHVLQERHWHEADGFYYDWDVEKKSLSRSMNQDAFYVARYLHQPDRSARLVGHLESPRKFGLRYTPTLSADADGFNPAGYWCGGYWPREAPAIAEFLRVAGHNEKALTLLLKALCSAQGKIIRENLNPITGEPNTSVVAMAYNVLLIPALLSHDLTSRGDLSSSESANRE